MRENTKRFLKSILIFLMFVVLFSGVILVVNFFKGGNQNQLGADNNEFLFLMAGVDSTGEDTGTRTDTLMLVKTNTEAKTMDLISIPRDSRVEINGYLDKINAAHSYGGIDLTMQTIRDFMGINLTYYLVIPFEAVVDGIDALGGIDVEVSGDVAEAMDISSGIHHFSGKEALDYVRFRKGYSNADLGRISTQQDFMMQFINEVSKPKNLPKLPIVYLAMKSKLKTNISLSQLKDLALAFRGMDTSKINQVRLDGEAVDIDGISYFEVYDESVQEIRSKYLSNFAY
ncbi:LCP family protein [uncultured Anaerococcus sp.]|uniref:LCP family protein n=1 Tax=uncultured Anaerococcus sp. TaxID=293428 RepID=UPI0026290F80|nr:LCP family protein [uncultured Anaerococcus sp.]